MKQKYGHMTSWFHYLELNAHLKKGVFKRDLKLFIDPADLTDIDRLFQSPGPAIKKLCLPWSQAESWEQLKAFDP